MHKNRVLLALLPHALYLEALGRGGLWGAGYEYLASERLGVGTTASYYALDGERIATLSPYLSYYPVVSRGEGRHRLLVQAGPQLVRESIPSPVPEWDGKSSLRLSAIGTVGYEFRDRALFRVYGMVAVGKGGLAPWLGWSVGWTF